MFALNFVWVLSDLFSFDLFFIQPQIVYFIVDTEKGTHYSCLVCECISPHMRIDDYVSCFRPIMLSITHLHHALKTLPGRSNMCWHIQS